MKPEHVKATILIPTTGNRGPLLQCSIASVSGQSLQEIEVFIIGDGVSGETRTTIHQLQEADARIHFFDHPKHPRRGEEYRHAALQQAKGEMVCYLCDRDLMLPNHVETLYGMLQTHDFAVTNYLHVHKDQTLTYGGHFNAYYGSNKDRIIVHSNYMLSMVGHRLSAYHALPFGWRTTPKDRFTDHYMWEQFMENGCSSLVGHEATFLYFKRDHHPGWPMEKCLPELQAWSKRITSDEQIAACKEEARLGLLKERLHQKKRLKSPFLIKGFQPLEIPSELIRRLSRRRT